MGSNLSGCMVAAWFILTTGNNDEYPMKIFMHIDSPELDEIAPQVAAAISDWIKDCGCTAELIDSIDDESGDHTLGMRIDTGKKLILKKALDFLYGIAQECKIDFVVGFIDAETDEAEKVCYFGHDEGRPDIDEIGTYLGLRR